MPKLAERYTTKYGFQCLEKNVTRFEAEHAFQISPEPLAVEDLNQYIVMANREHNLLYVCFYLHHIEKILNGRIYRFFHREGLYAYDPVRLLDYKLNCVSAIVGCCPGYDPDKGADFLTYAYYDIGNAILNCRRYEESGSFKNLDEYKTVRGIAWLYNKARDSRKKTIAACMEKTGCTKKTAEDYLTAARKNRGNVSIYETILRERDKEFSEDFDEYITEGDGEDLSRDAGGVYATMLWDSSWGGAVQRAHGKLDYRSQILIERHMDIFGQIQPCRHQNRGRAHGYAAEVNGEFRAASFTNPVNPVQTVIAFDLAEANEITTAVSLSPLFCIQDAASIPLPTIGNHSKVFVS